MIKKLLLGAVITSVTLFALPNSEMELTMIGKSCREKSDCTFNYATQR